MSEINRRDFIKNMALGAGLVMTPGFASAQNKVSANDKLNVAVVGVGAEGKVLLESMVKIPGLHFRAICDIWPAHCRFGAAYTKSRTKQKDMPKMYENYEDLIAKEKDLDAVVIATPDFWHSPQTCDFLKAGVNVYCEKMMAESKEKAADMVRAQRKSGKLLQIGHQRTSNPLYHYARDILIRQKNICGRLVNANGQWNRAASKDLVMPKKGGVSLDVIKRYGYEDEHMFMNWRWYKGKGGGPISDLGAHQLDIFGWIFGGKPIDVLASGDTNYYNKPWYDNVMCIINYNTFQKHTAKAFYQVLTATSAGGGYFEQFMGDEGAIKMSENPALIKIFRENNAPDWKHYIDEGVLKNSSAPSTPVAIKDARETKALVAYEMPKTLDLPPHMYHLQNFFDAVRGKCALNCDGAHAYEREAVVYKVVQAIEAQKTLKFEDSDFIVS
ncbi:MAG: Gfo/Idh/MocA family oxidoreductase [Opitutales bacterium]|nr:Gfo/Idh/MocA family oxidoreductase [Opitutales bacterium]